MINILFLYAIIIFEIIFTIFAVICLRLWDMQIVILNEQLEKDGDEIILLIKNLNKELIKLNILLEKLKQLGKINWCKIIIKALDVINILMILFPLKPNKVLLKRLFSIKSLKTILSLGN